jgi:glycosyltransferase involved in cell wall biosynthesis
MMGPDKRDGSLDSTLQLASRLGVREQIVVPGAVDGSDVPLRLASGDIFLNTSNVDNTPVSVLEAMACGLCVISTDVGGMRYLIEDGTDGLLVPHGNGEAMAAAIRLLISDRGLAAHISANARRKALRYDSSVVIPVWERLFCSIPRFG